ncbi:hypothetical protein Tco_0686859 [Tanacetum coccineum]
MELAKKVRVIVEASESSTKKFVKTMVKKASFCRTSCIYWGEDDHSFAIRSPSESKMASTKWGMSQFRLARTLVTSTINQVALLEAVLHLRMEKRSSYMKI